MLIRQNEEQKMIAVRKETVEAVSRTERDMNKSTFARLHEDAELVEKIRERYVPVRPKGGHQILSQSDRGGGGVAGCLAENTSNRTAKMGSPLKRTKGRTTRRTGKR